MSGAPVQMSRNARLNRVTSDTVGYEKYNSARNNRTSVSYCFVTGRLRTQNAAYRNIRLIIIEQEIYMLSVFCHLMKNDQGATAIEYTLIASLIAVAAITGMKTVGGKLTNVLSNVAGTMN